MKAKISKAELDRVTEQDMNVLFGVKPNPSGWFRDAKVDGYMPFPHAGAWVSWQDRWTDGISQERFPFHH